MNSRKQIYFLTLVGAIAGLASWFILLLMRLAFPALAQSRFLDAMNMIVLGAVISAMTVGFSDYWAERRIVPLWVGTGLVFGFAVGTIGGLLVGPIQAAFGDEIPLIGRIIPWALAGELIGFGVGMRWVTAGRHRPIISMVGGMVGASFGGLLFSLSGWLSPDITDFVQASAFVFTGIGIAGGITLAPTLLSDGAIRFVGSSDPRAYNKSRNSDWSLRQGDKLLIGSLSSQYTRTLYRKEVEIFLSDSEVAPRHAYVFGKEGRFYIESHPENIGSQGQPIKALKIRDRAVIGVQELHSGDLITVGVTQLRFETSRRRVRQEDSPDLGLRS